MSEGLLGDLSHCCVPSAHCPYLHVHSHPLPFASQRVLPRSASTAPASGNSRGTKSVEQDPSPPHPTGTRHPFDQVATCPPAVKQSTGEPQGRSFPWGVKCPIRSRGLCTEAPGSVWLPAGPRRTVWTHPLNKRVTGAAVSSSPVNKYQRALSAAGIIDQPLNSASGSRCCNSHRALPAAER